MIAENQHVQICQSQEIVESLQDISQGNMEPQLSEGLQNLPILERYLANEYQNYRIDDITLSSVRHIKNKTDLEIQRNAMISYFQNKPQYNSIEQKQRKLRGQISSQFITSLHNIPSYSIIYLTIVELKDNRFNMIARNNKGECLAYFWKQRKCKKIQKIFKFLSQVSKPVMVIIFDQTIQTKVNIPEIEKIYEVANQFVYIFENVEHTSVKIDGNTLRSEMTVQKGFNCCLQFIGKQLVVCTPNLNTIFQTQWMNLLTDKIKILQQQDQQALSTVRGKVTEQQKNLSLDFVFINILRLWKCSPAQTIVIIQNLFMKQQQTFNQKEHFLKQKQISRELNKSANSHFPDKMDESKHCKRCQIVNKKKSKKTNVRCQGCSVRFKKDIPLCPECFADFHQRFEYYQPRIMLRKRYHGMRSLKKKDSKIINNLNVDIEKESQSRLQPNLIADGQQKQQQSPPRIRIDRGMLEKAKRMDTLLTQSFQLVNELRQKGETAILQVFLGAYLNTSLQKMQKISSKYPQLQNGITKFGAQVQNHIYNLQNRIQFQQFIDKQQLKIKKGKLQNCQVKKEQDS